MTLVRTLYLFALFALTLWVATATTLLFAADYPVIACESDKIVVVIDQPLCAAPVLGPTFGPGTCTGPDCMPACDDPLAWVPPGQRITIKLELTAE